MEGPCVKGLSEKVEGNEKCNWYNSHRDIKYSIENVANNIVITMYGASGVLEISRGTLCKI